MIWLKILGVLSDILPAVVAFIKVVEAEVGPGQGAAKKAAVLEFVGTLLTKVVPGLSPEAAAKAVEVASHIVDGIVSALNSLGIFKKKSAPVEAAPAS